MFLFWPRQKDIILKRISKRRKIEKDFGNLGEYQAQYFIDLYKSIDLYKLYSVIVDFLKENNVKYTMLDSRNKIMNQLIHRSH